jgi:hypothetical protein
MSCEEGKAIFRISPHSQLLKSIAITMIVAGVTAAQSLTPARPNRPATVPTDYVVTPFGYFHPSCVVHLAKGDVEREDENAVQHADGSYDNVSPCAYPRYDAAGKAVTGDERALKEPTISHSWIEYASTKTSSSFGELYAYWTVPPAPSANNGQTVFLFPGLEDYKDVVSIIQPVLGWNADFASMWGIASWNCCAKGITWEALPTIVNSGDTILGYMYDTCAAGTLSCATWDIIAKDLTSGVNSELIKTSSVNQTFNWAFAGALEVYDIVQCSDYPPNGKITFYDLALFNDDFDQVTSPSWSVTNASSGLTPQCSYGGSDPLQSVILNY